MRLSELQSKDIVNMDDGKKLGKIIDVEINDGNINNLIIEPKKFFFNIFNRKEDIIINYKNIKKIGEDVILVSTNI